MPPKDCACWQSSLRARIWPTEERIKTIFSDKDQNGWWRFPSHNWTKVQMWGSFESRLCHKSTKAPENKTTKTFSLFWLRRLFVWTSFFRWWDSANKEFLVRKQDTLPFHSTWQLLSHLSVPDNQASDNFHIWNSCVRNCNFRNSIGLHFTKAMTVFAFVNWTTIMIPTWLLWAALLSAARPKNTKFDQRFFRLLTFN